MTANPQTAYKRGDYYEKKVAALLRSEGYWVWQTRGSKGAADLIALKAGQLMLVQVKGGKSWVTHEAWNALYWMA